MPAIYAHDRLGCQVRQNLEGRPAAVIDRWPSLYMTGLQGPDILFYYHPLHSNPVSAVGGLVHRESGRLFFEDAFRVITESPDPAPAWSYLYGLLCHFALDATCHAWIDGYAEESGISHAEIEMEFDRRLMLHDELNPLTHRLTGHIHPSDRTAAVIAPFYPGISARTVSESLCSVVLANELLLARTPLKRAFLDTVFRLADQYGALHGHVISPKGNPACRESSRVLRGLYLKAAARAARFIRDADGYRSGTIPFDPLFDRSFNGI